MKVGDLVKLKLGPSPLGFIVKIDNDFYGARQAFKTHPVARGNAIYNTRSPDFIAKTKKGITDRVMVCWSEDGFTYEDSSTLEVVSEAR